MVLLPLLAGIANVWYRMAANGALLTAAALLLVPLPWRALFAITGRGLVLGLGAAVVQYAAGAMIFVGLRTIPAAALQISSVYAWRHAVPGAFLVPLLLAVVLAEEVVWRNAVTLPLAARLGPWTGVALAASAFAAAHLSLGVPILLVAALAAGAFWSALVVKTRSAVPALVAHALWDVAVLLAWPYGGR